MKKLVLASVAAASALTLAACGGADEATEAEATTDDVMIEMEAPVEDTDNISISEDGVSMDINDADTSISAEVSDDPSITMESE